MTFFSTSSSWFLKLPNTSLQIVFFLKVLTLTLFYQAPKFETSLCLTLRETVASVLLTVKTGKPALLNLCWINEKAVSLAKKSITFSPFSAFFTQHDGEFQIAIRIYRGVFLFVLVTFLLAVNTWGWRKAGVNHVLIFELDPRDHLSYQQLLEVMAYSW